MILRTVLLPHDWLIPIKVDGEYIYLINHAKYHRKCSKPPTIQIPLRPKQRVQYSPVLWKKNNKETADLATLTFTLKAWVIFAFLLMMFRSCVVYSHSLRVRSILQHFDIYYKSPFAQDVTFTKLINEKACQKQTLEFVYRMHLFS